MMIVIERTYFAQKQSRRVTTGNAVLVLNGKELLRPKDAFSSFLVCVRT